MSDIQSEDAGTRVGALRNRVRRPSLLRALAVDKIGAVYIWVAIVIVFSFWAPETFPTAATARQILNANAVTALAAMAILIPLAAGVFDLSFAYTMTLSGVVVVKLILGGTGLVQAIIMAMLVAVVVG